MRRVGNEGAAAIAWHTDGGGRIGPEDGIRWGGGGIKSHSFGGAAADGFVLFVTVLARSVGMEFVLELFAWPWVEECERVMMSTALETGGKVGAEVEVDRSSGLR